ncbi:head maturation protease, ClpP-related [Pseudogracilibacillus auburnensis]|nr:head maturation protease, ClpP-related [Pseudogracilibacillus auburnensis]MBO1003743.1 Clp protease ClpP [Pseudogracilibacillus auburnensis]PXW88816.1 ATP-dependent protease ClpP protease subunit [Pseudogracilibacillus auburnensis]
MIKNKLHYPIVNSVTPINKNKSNLITVKNLTDTSAELYIYGQIVDNTDWKWDESDVMPDDVKEALEKVEGLDELNIYINSPGGSVFSGLAIYNMLKRNKAKKIVHIDGVAASMASIIALVGDEVYMPSNAFMMIHKPLAGLWGNADELRKVANDLDTINIGMTNIYKENLREGIDIDTLTNRITEEVDVWLDADQASEYFNINLTGKTQIAASAVHMLEQYKNVPKSLLEVESNNEPKSEPKPQPQSKTDDELEKIKIQNELDLLSL